MKHNLGLIKVCDTGTWAHFNAKLLKFLHSKNYIYRILPIESAPPNTGAPHSLKGGGKSIRCDLANEPGALIRQNTAQYFLLAFKSYTVIDEWLVGFLFRYCQ